jgi:hypothetical protein
MRVGKGRVVRSVCAPLLALAVGCCVSATSLALPSSRAYEMVSPPYKGGYGIGVLNALAPDGESVVFSSIGVFAGVSWAMELESVYVARRSPAGWVTGALSSPPTFGVPMDFSATLEYTLASGSLESTKLGVPEIGNVYVLHRTDAPDTAQAWNAASWEVAGDYVLKLPPPDELAQKGLFRGASADLCHIFFNDAEGPLLPEAEGTAQGTQLYDLAAAPAGGCHGDGSRPLRLVSVKNTPGPHGEPEPIDGKCIAQPGLGLEYGTGQLGSFNRFPAGGEEAFFTTCLGSPGTSPHELFVRLGGEKTIEVSRPLSEACKEETELPCAGGATRPSADFKGASEDGSRVFFTTTASLVGEDKDTTSDLYMATIGCPEGEPGCPVAKREVTSLTQVSHDPTGGQAAEVQGVVRIAADGSRVYFVARGDLLSQAEREALEGEGRAVPNVGGENLYVYDVASGRMVFVADLCSGPGLSGAVADRQCPADLDEAARNDKKLWGAGQEAQSTPDGRFLLFSTYARLSKGDTDNAKDLYRYDAFTGALERVSLGEAGHDANGNRNDEEIEVNGKRELGREADATIPLAGIESDGLEMRTRAISEDGSRIVFTSSEPLSPDAVNGLANVYEWHQAPGEPGEGHVSLISSGSSPTFDNGAVISQSGRDVFFLTTAQLVRQDTEEAVDVYDARLGGGFPAAPAERQPCSGDACQGPLTNPAPLLVPGSVPQAPGGNFAAPVKAKAKPKKAKPKPKKKRKKKKGKASGRSGKAHRAAGRSGR